MQAVGEVLDGFSGEVLLRDGYRGLVDVDCPPSEAKFGDVTAFCRVFNVRDFDCCTIDVMRPPEAKVIRHVDA